LTDYLLAGPRSRRWWTLAALVAALATYYALFYFPPRLVGSNEPDRFYHLAISRLVAGSGFPRNLPQAEDLGWGHYFADKEFLFHALTGLGWRLGGDTGVMLVTPLLACGIVATLYLVLARVLPPARAGLVVGLGCFLSAAFVFRLSLLRPHLLAILCFCLVLAGILRNRPWLAAGGAAGFALSYHALYVPGVAIAIAACIPWSENRHRRWLLPALAMLVATVVNPYFPGSVQLGWLSLGLALGVGVPPGWSGGMELQPYGLLEYLGFFGFLPLLVLGSGALFVQGRARDPHTREQRTFVFALAAVFVLLSLRSARATEYAIPVAILLAGYSLALARMRWMPMAAVLALGAIQGSSAFAYYRDAWQQPQGGDTPLYLGAIADIPLAPRGAKVFNCEWEAGSYLLYARPDLRFVDLLEPAFLWHASPSKYLARMKLVHGQDPRPAQTLRETFGADFVLCGNPGLLRQMRAETDDFEELRTTNGVLHVYRLR
jgi:hypothetical protein